MDELTAIEYLAQLEDDIAQAIINEWEKAKGNSNARQAWNVISKGMLIKEWQYNRNTGLVHDRIIEKIQDICINNYLKLYVNSVLMGHTPLSSYDFAEIFIPEEWDEEKFEEFLEDFEWFAIDNKGNWRISDYGLDKILNYVLKLIMENDNSKKLVWIDFILNVAHQRSDLASWFVEGGSITLSELSE